MAGQRTGRSRFGFKMVLVAVVCCALHLTDLNGYQTLAVSAGAPNRAELQNMKKSELKENLREQGLKVSGLKADLIERLMQPWEKRNIPGEEPANNVTDVFVPLEGTIQKLEELLEKKRVVWIRAGVATGKSTLAKHFSMTRPSKYLQVNHPKRENAPFWESWKNELRKTLLKETSTADVANGDLDDAFERLYDSDQVLIFDDCHLLFSCPTLSQLLLTPPNRRHRRVKVLMLSTAEAEEPQGEFWTTPREVTAKYMWTPPIPLPSQLVDQLAAADVYLTEAAIEFFMRFCGGHRNIFMRSMQWVQNTQKKEKKSTRWDVRRTLREVKQSCDNGNWTNAATSDLLGMLVQSCAIRGKGKCKDATSIPKEFVDILCQGASWLKLPVCRDLTRQGFVLPCNTKHQEFEPYNWDLFGARYGVSNPLLAAYYRQLLQNTRQLKVDVDREVTSCMDLLLRALPYLNFAEVAVKVQNKKVQYTSAIIRMLQSLGFGNVAALEDGANGNVDINFLQDRTTFAIEAVMAKQSLGDIAEHRSRFDDRSKPNYQKAAKKCLVIIGELDRVRKHVREVQGGIEVVGLAPNEGHVGYTVCVKGEGEGVVEFDIECDGVAKKLTSLSKTPYFEVAQRLQSIAPGY